MKQNLTNEIVKRKILKTSVSLRKNDDFQVSPGGKKKHAASQKRNKTNIDFSLFFGTKSKKKLLKTNAPTKNR